MKAKFFYVLSLLVIVSMALTACSGNATPTTGEPIIVKETVIVEAPAAAIEAPAAATGPKVLYGVNGFQDVPTIDPALAEDNTSIQIVQSAFIGLTHLEEVTSAVEPGMAETWDVVDNADGTQTMTFHLRSNVPWVRWNGESVETVKNCEGSADRMVTAGDFAYGIYRNLLPTSASPYAFLLGFVLQGAADFNNGTTEDFSTVGVKALDDTTLEMQFKNQAAYNPQIASLWIAYAQPKWLIEGDCDGEVQARGERWTEPGFYQTYGPYTVSEWIHDSSMTLVKNPFWPGTKEIPQAKIDEIHLAVLDDPAALAEYEAGNLDYTTGVPQSDIDRVKTDPTLSAEFNQAPAPSIYYYGFNTKAPFVDDARVRRALSLAIDRQSLIDNVTKGGQIPARWFVTPGLAGAPTLEKYPNLGVTYDPEKAKAELQSYLDEKGLTADQLDLTLMFNTSAGHQRIAEALQQMWKDTLGVNVKLVNQDWKVYLVTTKSEDTPQIFRLTWGQDYPDANNFDREVLAVNGSQNPARDGEPYGGINWKNDAYEKLVADAAVEKDPVKRMDLYAQAEQILVWDDAAIAPVYWTSTLRLTKPYVVRTYGVGGHEAFYKWDILPH